MAPQVVHLHIGAHKTGTTYVQAVLRSNKVRLADDGVLVPGDRRRDSVKAARQLVKWDPKARSEPGNAWDAVVADINGWSGPAAIFSMEFLSRASNRQAKYAVKSLPQHTHVKVILTVRDVARLVPAQWQSSMRQGRTWTLQEYADAVASDDVSDPAYRHFWARHDSGPILARWCALVGKENVTVITLPPSGSAPDELWRRFSTATGIEPDRYESATRKNASLGAASAEVMRQLNAVKPQKKVARRAYRRSVNGALSHKVLDLRRSQEDALTLPDGLDAWAREQAQRITSQIQAVDPVVIGDLQDLMPGAGTATFVAPDLLPPQQVLDAAIYGLAGLSAAHAKAERKAERLIKRRTLGQKLSDRMTRRRRNARR